MKTRYWAIALLGAWMLPATASAQTVIPYNYHDLFEKKIPIDPATLKKIPTGKPTVKLNDACTVALNDEGTVIVLKDVDACKELWDEDPAAISIVQTSDFGKLFKAPPSKIEMRVPKKDSRPVVIFDESAHKLRLKEKPSAGELYVVFYTGAKDQPWSRIKFLKDEATAVPHQEETITDDADESFLKKESAPKMFANFDASLKPLADKNLMEVDFQKPPSPSADGKSDNEDKKKIGGDSSDDKSDFCSLGPRTDPAPYLVCVDFIEDTDNPAIQFRPETRQLLRPNRAVLVKVRYLSDQKVTIGMEGERGLFKPPSSNLTQVSDANRTSGSTGSIAARPVVAEHTFGPRLPGKADVVVKLKKGTEEVQQRIEFIVEETYSAALTLGVGGIFGAAVDRSYEARTRGGSSQSEIAVTAEGRFNFELVLGFLPYFEKEGRGAVTGCYPWCFGPYVGIGVVNQSASGLEVFRSVHAGLAWQPTPTFSIGLTAVGRRVTRLQDGYDIGSPVSGDVPTVQRFDVGAGLILNLSPDFLRLASQSGTGFLR